ncbi:MAG: hypothetical protein EAZ92_17395 [Candidatus Kapaibacterium sp.]|nr:MAG: hypothetical protein EAZ92_17395 [Candidatus Kapabacteria bacterium]
MEATGCIIFINPIIFICVLSSFSRKFRMFVHPPENHGLFYIFSLPMQAFPQSPSEVYHTRLDEKQRIVIRNPQFTSYEVREFSDGHIELVPRTFVASDDTLSLGTLQMMDAAMSNLANGIASTPVDTAELLALLDDDDKKELEEARRVMKE